MRSRRCARGDGREGADLVRTLRGDRGKFGDMAQPPFVPQGGPQAVRHYSSPPQRVRSWRADRPGDLPNSPMPAGGGYGHQGPDQGYALNLAKRFIPLLKLQPGESANDVVAGCVTVALKRASLFGRAPVVEDLRVAFAHWGFLDLPAVGASSEASEDSESAGVSEVGGAADALEEDFVETAASSEPESISERRALFSGAGGHDGYACRRRIADSVSPSDLGVPAALCEWQRS